MKRIQIFLGLALVLAFAPALAGKLPADAQFDAVIKGVLFPPDPKQLSPTKPLDLVLEALAKSVGLQTLIYREYDDKGVATIPRMPNIKFDFQGKRFREIWDLLFNTYGLQLGLDFVVLGNNTVVVAPNELISGLSDATQRTGASQRQLYLVDIPAATYLDKEGKADYDKAKLWVKDNFIPFANREFGGLAINWLVVEGSKSEAAAQVSILRVLVSVLGSESQQLRFQETLARSRYGFELLPTALELAAIQAAASPPEEPEKPTERIFTLRNTNFSEISSFLTAAIPGLSVSPLPTNPAAALLKGTPTQLRRVTDLLPQLDIARPTTPETPLLDRTITLKNVAFADIREFLVSQLPKVAIAPIPTNPKVAVVRASEADLVRLNELIAVVDLPKLISAGQERQLYLIDIPASSYLVQNTVQVQENGRTETRNEIRSDYDKAKTWVRDNFLTFANREFESPATNWIVVEVGQTLKLLASIVASPAQQLRFQETLVRSRFGFEILPSADLNRPATPENENRVITLKHVGFATIKNFLEGQLPKISIAISPTNPGLAIVRGSAADLDQLNELLKIVDVPQPTPAPFVEQVITTQHVGTASIRDFLLSLLPKLSISPSPTNPNLAVVRGSQPDLDKLADLLKVIDVPKTANPGPANLERIFTTQAAPFPDIKDFLAANLPSVSISVSPNNPRLALVRGSQPDLDKLADLLKIVDVAQPLPVTPELPSEQTFILKNVPFSEIKDFLTAAVPGITINILPTKPDSAVIKGLKAQLARVAELITQVDTPRSSPSDPTPVDRVVTSTNVPFADLRSFLESQLPKVTLAISPTNPNLAVVRGSQADLGKLTDLLKIVDVAKPVPPAPAPVVEQVITTQHVGTASIRDFLLSLLPKLSISPSPTNPNLAVVRGSQTDLDKLADLLKVIDVPKISNPGPANLERIFTTQAAPFPDIKDFLAANLPSVSISVSPSNPRLALVRGSQPDLDKLAELIKIVDTPREGSVQPPLLEVVITTQHVPVASFKDFILAQLPKLVLSPSPTNPRLAVVRGSQADLDKLAELIRIVDVPQPAQPTPENPIEQTVTLRNVPFSDVKDFLTAAVPGITVNILPTKPNAALVRGYAAQIARVVELLGQVDLARPLAIEPSLIDRVVTLKYAVFLEVREFLLGQLPRVVLAASPTNPRLAVVRGTQADLDKLAELIKLVDVAPPTAPAAEPPSERLFTLKNTGFDAIKDFLQAAVPGLVVQVLPTNPRSALLRGSQAQLKRVDELLPQVDIAPIVPGPSTAAVVVKPYALNTLGYADLNRLYQQSFRVYLPNTTLREVTATPGAFTLEATPEQHQLFADLLAKIDRPETARLSEQVQVVPLTQADPSRVARLVRQYYPNTTLSVVGRSLVFKATPLDTAGLIQLINRLDAPAPEQKVFPLYTRDTASLELALRRALLARGLEVNVGSAVISTSATPNLNDEALAQLQLAPASVELLPASQRILVTGSAGLFELVGQLLGTLDPPPATLAEAAPLEQVFALQNVPFANVRDFLLGQLPKISLAVVPTNPKLALVRGTAAELERLASLVKLVDVAAPVALPADAPRLRQVYTLQFVPARTVIASLKDFLNRELPGARLEEIPGNPSAIWFEGLQAQVSEFDRLLKAVDVRPATPPVVLERRSFTLSFADPAQVAQIVQRDFPGSTVDVVGKQLIVRAQPSQLAELANLLANLDVARAALLQKTYLLSHAQATALAPVLTEAVGARSQTASSGTSTPAAAANSASPPPAISIVADERTNALVVTGEASLVALVDELVAQLDLPVAQVNIQVRVQEVTSSVVSNLGLRWETVAGGNILASLLETGLSLIFDSTRSLASLNLRVTLDALQEQGLSRTLNDSNITVLNNQTGRIQSGQTIFLRQTQPSSTGDRGPSTEQVPFEIGVIVEVTPRIAADGSIVMQIVTDISGSNLQRNPTDGLIDRFDRQSSSSSLRIKDGQTIVLGGLIQKRNGQNSSGIPLLSEIPLLGSLFKQQKFEDSDRELLIVITGNIVKDAPTNRR